MEVHLVWLQKWSNVWRWEYRRFKLPYPKETSISLQFLSIQRHTKQSTDLKILYQDHTLRQIHDHFMKISRRPKNLLQSNRLFFSAQRCKLPPQCWYFDWQFALSNLQPARTTCLRKLQICSRRFLYRILSKLKISLGTFKQPSSFFLFWRQHVTSTIFLSDVLVLHVMI